MDRYYAILPGRAPTALNKHREQRLSGRLPFNLACAGSAHAEYAPGDAPSCREAMRHGVLCHTTAGRSAARVRLERAQARFAGGHLGLRAWLKFVEATTRCSAARTNCFIYQYEFRSTPMMYGDLRM
eukprot:4532813-Pleurochrysis_carterae.AAC.1